MSKGALGESIVIAVVGVLMIVYVLVGGMKGTTWVQIIKAVLLIIGAAAMTVMVLAKFGLNFSEIFGSAQSAVSHATTKGVASRNVLAPGAQYGGSTISKINLLSLGLALVLGTAGLPHVLDALLHRAARERGTPVGGVGDRPDRRLLPVHARAGLRRRRHRRARPHPQGTRRAELGRAAAGLRTRRRGPARLISAVAFATILAVVAGLTITASTSFAHDIYASLIKARQRHREEQVRVSRITAVVLGVFGIALGILANGQNVAFLVALRSRSPPSANLPTILYSLYWRRFNTRGALWSMYGGLISAIVLIVFSPAVSGAKTAMIPGADFAWFPLANPGIVSIPLAFILGIVGTLSSPTAAIRCATPRWKSAHSPASAPSRPLSRTNHRIEQPLLFRHF